MVHVSKVEIFGFKSFGFKNTIVGFEPGLMSISGPNGSGKSNILDAIIFAMGENKPKTMRVDKLRSLLHDIEGNRRGPKMARVSVHFDNSDRKIPVDSDSVEITREMDDKGENVYYLNKKKTNRSQIIDLMDVANAGLNNLNAVQQGTVTRISEFSAEEKRKSIEDLVGLSYFDEKKSNSIKELEEADRKLSIALARMDEVKKRIDELEEERNLKLRYDILEREINRYQAISASNKMKLILSKKDSKEKLLHEITRSVSELDGKRNSVRQEIQELEEQKSKFMAEVNAYNEAKATIDSEISDAMQKFEESNSVIITSEKRIEQITSRIPEINDELTQIQNSRSEIENQISVIRESMNEISSKRSDITNQLHDVDEQRTKILDQQSHIAKQKLEIDNKIKKLTDQLNDAQVKLAKLENEKESLHNKIKLNTSRLNEFETNLNSLQLSKTKLDSLMNNHTQTIVELKKRISNFNSTKTKQEKELEELESILEKSSKAANQYDTKIKTVKGLMHEDYTIAKIKEIGEQIGIIGLAYEMVKWDKQYDRAMLAVSSDWIKAIVVNDFTTLLSLAEVARSKQLPKLKIIPIDAIPKFNLKLPKKSGVIGVLSDYVKCDSKYSALKTFLFGNVILTDSQEPARNLSKSGYKAVTLDGEYFEAKGGGVIIDINSKISKLTKIISMSTSVDGLLRSTSMLKKYIQKQKLRIKKTEEIIQTNKDRLSISEKSLATAENSYSDLKWKISSATNLQKQLAERNSEFRTRSNHLLQELSQQESYVDSIKDRIAIVEENYANGEQTRIANELSRINEKKSKLEEMYTTINSEYQTKSSDIGKLTGDDIKEKSRSQNLRDEITSLNLEKDELKEKITSLENQRLEKKQVLEKLRDKEQDLISTSGKSVDQLHEYDDKLKTLGEQDKSYTKDVNYYERQYDSLNRDLTDLSEEQVKIKKIIDAFGFNDEMEDFDVEPLIDGLAVEQKALTALNGKAPEQYVEVSYGYRSMSVRKNSLEGERTSIVNFIEKIERDKKQTFLDAFDTVDKEIRSIFNKMTGGNAWLEIQNEDDIFNSGLSYLIQFPNKPKRESTSISGGEKTLAAVVFVLALQKLKPSPFYLFDEVDAHLDAPNSERLSKILEERAKKSQFIMVSLKDSVVQKAKLIYGVYPKNGISQVVTYKDKRNLPSIQTS